MAASVYGKGFHRWAIRDQTPTKPLGEKIIKPTNNKPKYNNQLGVQMDRNSLNKM
jgi:hypothetical protein